MIAPITTAEREEWKRLVEAATPGDWSHVNGDIFSKPVVREWDRLVEAIPDDAPDDAYEGLPDPLVAYIPFVPGVPTTVQDANDTAFIAASRLALPRLLAALEESEAREESLKALLDHAKRFVRCFGWPCMPPNQCGACELYGRIKEAMKP